jgi:site-specific DNA-adenine methylase
VKAIGEGAICKYFGSKLTSSQHYPAPTDEETIVEPFAGGAGYSIRHWQRSDGSPRPVLLIEKNPRMAALWQWLIQADPGEVLRLPVDLPVGSDIRDALGQTPQAELVARWQRVGAFRQNAGGYVVSAGKRGKDGKPKPADVDGLWCTRTRERVAAGLHRFRTWRCLCAGYDALELAPGDGPALVYVDPPYQHFSPRNYPGAHEPLDFKALGAWCQRQARHARVVVCEARDEVRNREPDWLPFEPLGVTIVGAVDRGGERGRKRDGERIWTSFERIGK